MDKNCDHFFFYFPDEGIRQCDDRGYSEPLSGSQQTEESSTTDQMPQVVSKD